MRKITLEEIIKTASAAYSVDGDVQRAFSGDKYLGDGLAEFVASELKDVYDGEASREDNVRECERAMETAVLELTRVQIAIGELILSP